MDSEVIVGLVGTTIAGFILYSITTLFVLNPGVKLRNKFISLGDMRGKHKNEIYRVVGTPNSISAHDDGELLQWLATGYHIALIFQNDICQGISHEYAHTNLKHLNVTPPKMITTTIPASTILDTNETDELEAKKCFAQAKELLSTGNKAMAIDVLEDLVRRFPKSKQAASARRSLGIKE